MFWPRTNNSHQRKGKSKHKQKDPMLLLIYPREGLKNTGSGQGRFRTPPGES